MSDSGTYLDYLNYYRDKLIKENGDKNEIQRVEQLIQQINNPTKSKFVSQGNRNISPSSSSKVDQSKMFRDNVKRQAQKTNAKPNVVPKAKTKPATNTAIKKKRKVKNKPLTLKDLGIAIAIGTCVGIPLSFYTYHSVKNMPTNLNYTTVEEKKKGMEHDDTNYRKFLKQTYHLTDEEIDKRIELEEDNGRWGRIPDKEIGDD